MPILNALCLIPRTVCFGVLALFLIFSIAPLYADEQESLSYIDALASGGAAQLALRWLQTHQPPMTDFDRWLEWEKRRLKVYRGTRQWRHLTSRVDEYLHALSGESLKWALTEAAEAGLEAGDQRLARRYLRNLIWGVSAETNEFAYWQRMLIRSYIDEGELNEARAALEHYMKFFRAGNDAWKLLYARVLASAGDYRRMYSVLSDVQSPEGRSLQWLAGLRARITDPRFVSERAKELLRYSRKHPEIVFRLHAMRAECAGLMADWLLQASELEKMLSTTENLRGERLVTLNADDLWHAYQQLAESVGARGKLAAGDENDWLDRAKALKEKDPVRARAIYALLTYKARTEKTRDWAHEALVQNLVDAGLLQTVRRLYTESQRFREVMTIPTAVRYRLALTILQDYDIDLAAYLAGSVEAAPKHINEWHWSLQRARILLYAGKRSRAVELLRSVLDDQKDLSVEQAERYMQVLFDLQTIDRHEDALGLFEELYVLMPAGQAQRETLYWMADSKMALRQYEDAAQFYLRSAAYGQKGNRPDMWGKSAYFRAAEALTQAGLFQDAGSIYKRLFGMEAEIKQRAILQRKLEQLWLFERKNIAQ